MRLATFIYLTVILQAGILHAQAPQWPPPPNNFAPPPPIDTTLRPSNPPQLIQQTSSKVGPVKPGDQVRVLQDTIIRSGPGDQAYSCARLNAGAMVNILDLPSPGSEYTPIEAPDNCYSLIPETAVRHTWFSSRPKDFFVNKQKTIALVETLMDSEQPVEEHLSSKSTLAKGTLVSIVNEKKIKIQGKEKVYLVIRVNHKERRFVRTADLEGVAEAARAANPTMNTNPYANTPGYGNQPSSSGPLYGYSTPQQASYDQDQLPPLLLNQVQTADQVYQRAMRVGAWEDCRQRYQHLLECDVLSIRILAKNRLEFISEWQKNPPVVTTAMSPQQGASGYPPTLNTEPWVPSSIAPARPSAPASTTSLPAFPKDPKEIIIRPTPPVATPTNNTINIPTYQGTPATTAQATGQPVAPPPQGQVPARATPAAAAAAPRMKVQGKLNLAVQYTGADRLYYLTNSQQFMTYYVRGIPNSGVRLNDYVNKFIEIEGWGIQASIDGKPKPQINVDRVRLLQ